MHSILYPGSPVPVDSVFYIERLSIENLVYQEIYKSGSIIQIKAPRRMGKTSFVLRLIDRTQKSGYSSIYLDFQQAEEEIFASIDKFLRWFCANVSRQLQLKPVLDDYWNEDIGSKMNCTIFFQHYILPQIDSPLVLVLNEFNQIFDYPNIAQEFLGLLRFWNESAKHNNLFHKLRLVLVYSTEFYIHLNINESPLNLGLIIRLPEFSLEEIQDLAGRYGLPWNDSIGKRHAFALKSMLGGHPYLVQLAIYHLVNNPEKSLENILLEAHTITGIYSSHLRSLLLILQENPELAIALKQLIDAGGKSVIEHIIAYKLESLGLVKIDSNQCTFSCELYRKYFSSQNLEQNNLRLQMEDLELQKQLLEYLSYTDDLTQLFNQRYFEVNLQEFWQNLAITNTPMSLILLDVDHLKIYNQTQGREAGDICLWQIANTLSECINRSITAGYRQKVAARYGGGEFAILLPNCSGNMAFQIAESIRKAVKKLSVYHEEKYFGLTAPVVTVSLGVTSTIPTLEESHNILLKAARKALDDSKNNGRDRTTISSDLNYGFVE
jgi:diguanylate cyclase (GGDEF)-like protein